MDPDHAIAIGGDTSGSVAITGSHNLVIRAQQVMLKAAQKASEQGRDPAHMLRVLTLLAAPVFDPKNPKILHEPLDLRQEWEKFSEGVRQSHAPILLARLALPTLGALRATLSPRAELQQTFPHVLHFSGHALSGGLLLKDEFGQVHRVTTKELVEALRDMPQPLNLVVLNGCETAAAQAVAGALLEGGRARAVVGHLEPVFDKEAMKFAARLFAELTNTFPLRIALENARQAVTTHRVKLLGDGNLCLKEYLRPRALLINDRRSLGNLPSRGDFFGRSCDLVEIASTLENRRLRVVLLSGSPGIGKSTLLLEVAHRNAWRFPGGVAFTDLTPAPWPLPPLPLGEGEGARAAPGVVVRILFQLAAVLKIKTTANPDQIEQALIEYTSLQPTLPLLDNTDALPESEIGALYRFLERLGAGSAALIASRRSLSALCELPSAAPYELHHGLEACVARLYFCLLAERKRIPLDFQQAEELLRAAEGHPRLLELLAAWAGERDLGQLLRDVRERRGDFQAQLERVYDWCAKRAGEDGRCAWSMLPLFLAGRAPERLLRALCEERGLQALRGAALAEFDHHQQAWTWHAAVSEYARAHWPLKENERLALLEGALPVWREWREELGNDETVARLEVQAPNLEPLLAAAPRFGREATWDFLNLLAKRLPAPNRTLARGVQPMLYQAMLALA